MNDNVRNSVGDLIGNCYSDWLARLKLEVPYPQVYMFIALRADQGVTALAGRRAVNRVVGPRAYEFFKDFDLAIIDRLVESPASAIEFCVNKLADSDMDDRVRAASLLLGLAHHPSISESNNLKYRTQCYELLSTQLQKERNDTVRKTLIAYLGRESITPDSLGISEYKSVGQLDAAVRTSA